MQLMGNVMTTVTVTQLMSCLFNYVFLNNILHRIVHYKMQLKKIFSPLMQLEVTRLMGAVNSQCQILKYINQHFSMLAVGVQ